MPDRPWHGQRSQSGADTACAGLQSYDHQRWPERRPSRPARDARGSSDPPCETSPASPQACDIPGTGLSCSPDTAPRAWRRSRHGTRDRYRRCASDPGRHRDADYGRTCSRAPRRFGESTASSSARSPGWRSARPAASDPEFRRIPRGTAHTIPASASQWRGPPRSSRCHGAQVRRSRPVARLAVHTCLARRFRIQRAVAISGTWSRIPGITCVRALFQRWQAPAQESLVTGPGHDSRSYADSAFPPAPAARASIHPAREFAPGS